MTTVAGFIGPSSPAGLEPRCLTPGPLPSCHVYMEAQVMTPDGRRLVLHESAHPHGSRADDPLHRYLLCDLDDDCRLTPLTDELGATAPALSADGRSIYYAVDRIAADGSLAVRVREIASPHSWTEIVRWERPPIPGDWRFASCYPLSTRRADDRFLVLAVGLHRRGAIALDYALLRVDLRDGDSETILLGPDYLNPHPQYSRSCAPATLGDLLIQHNHGQSRDPAGELLTPLGQRGVDLHLIRDDGIDWRDLPVGRDGSEFCQGHQCWRGDSDWLLVGTGCAAPDGSDDWLQPMVECRAAPSTGDHLGVETPRARRVDVSANAPRPDFRHFATDRLGQRLTSDCGPFADGGELWIAELGEAGQGGWRWRYLLDLHCSDHSPAHAHPFLAPDGRSAFFNSDADGQLRAYMLTGL